VSERWELLGTHVDALSPPELLDCFADAVVEHRRLVVLNHNLHSLALYQRDPEFRELYRRAELVFIDGMAVVGMLRVQGRPVRRQARLAVLDWVWPLFELAGERRWNVVHVGSEEPVISRAREAILERVPGLRLTTLAGFFDARPGSPESEGVLRAVAAARPDLLMVGMGMPRQERWILQSWEELPNCPVVTVGGVLGFLGGERPAAPRFLGQLGLEWLFRLLSEPGRLWRRYLLEPWALVPPMVREVMATKPDRRP